MACPRNISIISMIGAASSHDSEPRWNEAHSSENIVYEDGKQACRGSLNGPFRVVFSRGNSSRPRHTILTGLEAPYRYTRNLA